MIVSPYSWQYYVYVGEGIDVPVPEDKPVEVKKNDPFGLRAKYPGNKELIEVLDLIEKAAKKSNETGYLDFGDRANLSILSTVTTDKDEKVNLERLLLKTECNLQYPLKGAKASGAKLFSLEFYNVNLSGAKLPGAKLLKTGSFYMADLSDADLTGASALADDSSIITGQELKRELLKSQAIITDDTKF